uniref:Putative secreted protein n=1 Tax=Anopheles marajoara TaxID=58244 RepID=A0A2M4C6Q1_9DIPT
MDTCHDALHMLLLLLPEDAAACQVKTRPRTPLTEATLSSYVDRPSVRLSVAFRCRARLAVSGAPLFYAISPPSVEGGRKSTSSLHRSLVQTGGGGVRSVKRVLGWTLRGISSPAEVEEWRKRSVAARSRHLVVGM